MLLKFYVCNNSLKNNYLIDAFSTVFKFLREKNLQYSLADH